ncbi:hypothetical protein [uncultured Ruegeria sp.]|uniref:hypothetical protein n=1 Tax=uncultured Ruegeria sp. TaxID=259304 RepID=UPI002628A15A|nr:hypothetical protein [uncultured Ruegeria sp.]
MALKLGGEMASHYLRNLLASVATATSLSVAVVAAATFALAPDAAFAKNGNGNGKGNSGKADNGKGNGSNGKGNSSRGSQANGGGKNNSKGKASASQKSAGSKKQHAAKAKKSNTGTGGNQKVRRVSVGEFGREFKKDVQQLFGKQPAKKSGNKPAKKTRTYKTVSVKPIERSLRPVARHDGTPGLDGRKKHRYRDPLAAAITDPNGSDKLRNLNASKAASPAFRNAAANSNVGKIATYQAAAAEYYDLRGQLYDTRRDLRDLNERYDGRSSEQIADDIAALDPSDPEYDSKREALESELRDAETYEETRDGLRADLKDLGHQTKDALEEAEDAFFDASKGRSLTKDALGVYHDNLGLPQPKSHPKDEVTVQPVPYDPTYHQYSETRQYRSKDTNFRLRYDALHHDGKKHRYKDPLAAAITDPSGSSKLRKLNASKAATPAFLNAAANSNVGKIATYQAAAAEYYDLRDQLHDARRDLRDLNESYDGRSSDQIADDIAALDPGDPGYNDKLDALESELQDAQTFEEAQGELRADVRDLRTDSLVAQKEAEHAFFDASKGSTLAAETLADLHENLELPAPGKQ